MFDMKILGISLVIIGVIIIGLGIGKKISEGLEISKGFDITTDPTRHGYKHNVYSCPATAATQGNGLNVQAGGSQFTVCDFTKQFRDRLVSPETDPLDVIPRQYCAYMYEKFHEDFSDNWESHGICEQDIKEKLAQCEA